MSYKRLVEKVGNGRLFERLNPSPEGTQHELMSHNRRRLFMKKSIRILASIAFVSVIMAIWVNTRPIAPDKGTAKEVTLANLGRIELPLLDFYSSNHRWPDLSNWQKELKPYYESNGVFPFAKVIIDGWGSQIRCVNSTNTNELVLYSPGKNQIDDHGTNDDVALLVVRP